MSTLPSDCRTQSKKIPLAKFHFYAIPTSHAGKREFAIRAAMTISPPQSWITQTLYKNAADYLNGFVHYITVDVYSFTLFSQHRSLETKNNLQAIYGWWEHIIIIHSTASVFHLGEVFRWYVDLSMALDGGESRTRGRGMRGFYIKLLRTLMILNVSYAFAWRSGLKRAAHKPCLFPVMNLISLAPHYYSFLAPHKSPFHQSTKNLKPILKSTMCDSTLITLLLGTTTTSSRP